MDQCQIQTKMINGSFYTYRRIHFTSGNALFLWYLSLIIRESRVSQRPSGRAPRLLVLRKTHCDPDEV